MAVDYLSALNSQGSGLNITQIVDSLVEAEVAPKRNLISNSQSKTELRISELATLKSNLDVFQKSTDSFDLSSAFAFSNSNSAAITAKKIDNQFDGVLFFSPSAVNSFFKKNNWSSKVHAFSIGKSTSKTLEKFTLDFTEAKKPNENELLSILTSHYLKYYA